MAALPRSFNCGSHSCLEGPPASPIAVGSLPVTDSFSHICLMLDPAQVFLTLCCSPRLSPEPLRCQRCHSVIWWPTIKVSSLFLLQWLKGCWEVSAWSAGRIFQKQYLLSCMLNVLTLFPAWVLTLTPFLLLTMLNVSPSFYLPVITESGSCSLSEICFLKTIFWKGEGEKGAGEEIIFSFK